MNTENVTPGDFGPYRLLRVLGSGGMGIVYEAWDTRLDRRVALKMLHPHLLLDADLAARFKDEAKRAARIEHPNVVRVYRVDTYDDRVAIEMQFIDGMPLNAMLRDGPIIAAEAVAFLRQTLEALSACHRQGVIHCDLKPANLMIQRNGTVILTDFGIARALHDDAAQDENKTLTTGPLTSLMWGTPQYSPPEVWEGAPLGPQSDLYAAGVLTYESITGVSPFQAPNPIAIMKAICTKDIPSLHVLDPSVSTELSDLVGTLMARDVALRPKDANAVLAALANVPESSMQPMDTQRLERIPQAQTKKASNKSAGKPRSRARGWAVWAALPFLALGSYGIFTAINASGGTLVTTNPLIDNLLVVGNGAYFVAEDKATGRELWCYDSKTDSCRLVADIATGSASSNPRNFMKCATGGFVFTADTAANGSELWFCSAIGPDPKSVRLLAELSAGPMGSEPRAVASNGSDVLFVAKTLTSGIQIWRSNTISESVSEASLVKDTRAVPEEFIAMPSIYVDVEGIYFTVHVASDRRNVLYFYKFADKTLTDVITLPKNTGSMAKSDGKLFMCMEFPDLGNELGCYDEKEGKVQLVQDIWQGLESSNPRDLVYCGGRVFFKADTAERGKEIYATNGLDPVSTFEINEGVEDSDPSAFAVGRGNIFFKARDKSIGMEVWAMNPAGGGLEYVADVAQGHASSNPYNLVAVEGILFFTADDGPHGQELYVATRKDGKWQPTLIYDLYPGKLGAEPHHLQVTLDNHAFFEATTPDAGRTLCRLNIGTDIQGIYDKNINPTKIQVLRLYR